MKVGDLISFKPIGFSEEDWSPPCIVLRKLDKGREVWVVWCEGANCVVDEINCDVVYLVEGYASESGRLS